MKTLKGKRYRPEFTQLPYGFVNDNVALQRLMRTENGLAYFSMYIAIQDRMANHSDEDFTLSFDELIFETQSFLQLYTTPVDIIEGWINDLIEANIVEVVIFVNPFTDKDEERYCISSVVEILQTTRDAWITKITNPMKLDEEKRIRLNALNVEASEIQKKIGNVRSKKRTLNSELKKEYNNKTDFNKEFAEALHSEISDCDREIASLYRRYHTIDQQRQRFMKGGDADG